jgi:broad specificity phosphatase PhoE
MIAEVKKSEKKDYLWKTEYGENLKEVQERSVKFLNSIKQKHLNQKIVTVSHAATIRYILLGIIGHSAKNSYRISQENCNLNKLQWKPDNGWSIHSVNNTSHLS